MKIVAIRVYQVDLPLHEKSYQWSGGKSVQVFDSNISALEAGIGAFPRRLMVDEARLLVAKTILADAGELYDD